VTEFFIFVCGVVRLMCGQGDLKKAIKLLERGTAIQERNMGAQHLSVANYLCNWASCLVEDGNLTEALPLYARAWSITRAAYGDQHAQTLKIQTRLDQLEQQMGGNAVTFAVLAADLAKTHSVLASCDKSGNRCEHCVAAASAKTELPLATRFSTAAATVCSFAFLFDCFFSFLSDCVRFPIPSCLSASPFCT
jgi:hypothetical protein